MHSQLFMEENWAFKLLRVNQMVNHRQTTTKTVSSSRCRPREQQPPDRSTGFVASRFGHIGYRTFAITNVLLLLKLLRSSCNIFRTDLNSIPVEKYFVYSFKYFLQT